MVRSSLLHNKKSLLRWVLATVRRSRGISESARISVIILTGWDE